VTRTRALLARLQAPWNLARIRRIVRRLAGGAQADTPGMSYADWVQKAVVVEATEMAAFYADLPAREESPRISVIVPTWNTPVAWLEAAIHSVTSQAYPHWELCIADDASSDPAVIEALKAAAAGDSRIKVCFRENTGHIAQASNSALALASGDWCVFLDHDDCLAEHALGYLAREILAHPEARLIYSDEDQITGHGARRQPFFKPDWSPHLALSQAYLGHLVAIHQSLLAEHRFAPDLSGAQDYALWLECTDALSPAQIRHIPRVLYHWRAHPASTAQVADAKPYAHEAGRKAVAAAVARRYPDQAIEVVSGPHTFTYALDFSHPTGALASIIIPTRDGVELLAHCIQSIMDKTSGIEYEILIIDNRSEKPETARYLEGLVRQDSRVRVIPADFEFNWSGVSNLGAQHAHGDTLVFLNNDTEVISPEWLSRLAGYAGLPDVGVAGGLLLFPDGTIQHSGVVVGMGGWADHVFHGQPPEHLDPSNLFVSPVLTRNVLAVTGACSVISRSRFAELGAYDEDFIVCGSDVELCLRAYRAGYFNVLCAEARLLHHESKTRSTTPPARDFEVSATAYEPYRTQQIDPFFNPNLSLQHKRPSLRDPAEVLRP
jgi:GT2 family glycosyltransferase